MESIIINLYSIIDFHSKFCQVNRGISNNIEIMHQSIPSANIPPPPPGNPRSFAPIFSPGPEDLYHLNCPGVGPIIKVPSCQLMPHEGTFQLQTDLPSIATL